VPVKAEDEDRFKLYVSCIPVNLGVELGEVSESVQKIGLTEERVRTIVETRLRPARIHWESSPYPYFLAVIVKAMGTGFHTGLYFYIPVDRRDMHGHAVTWSSRGYGVHGQDA